MFNRILISSLLAMFAFLSAKAQIASTAVFLPPDASMMEMTRAMPLNLDQVRQEIGYPEKAIKAGFQGVVICRIKISDSGEYLSHEVLQAAHPILTSAVEENLEGLRFQPAQAGPLPVISWMRIPFTFELSEEDSNLPEEAEWETYLQWGIHYRNQGKLNRAEGYFEKAIALSRQTMTPTQDLFSIFWEKRINDFLQEDWSQAHSDIATLIAFAQEPQSPLSCHLPDLYLDRAFTSMMQDAPERAFMDYLWLGMNYPKYRPTGEELAFSLLLSDEEAQDLLEGYERLATYKGASELIPHLKQVYETQMVAMAEER